MIYITILFELSAWNATDEGLKKMDAQLGSKLQFEFQKTDDSWIAGDPILAKLTEARGFTRIFASKALGYNMGVWRTSGKQILVYCLPEQIGTLRTTVSECTQRVSGASRSMVAWWGFLTVWPILSRLLKGTPKAHSSRLRSIHVYDGDFEFLRDDRNALRQVLTRKTWRHIAVLVAAALVAAALGASGNPFSGVITTAALLGADLVFDYLDVRSGSVRLETVQ